MNIVLDSMVCNEHRTHLWNGAPWYDEDILSRASTVMRKKGPFKKNPPAQDGYRNPSSYSAELDELALRTTVRGEESLRQRSSYFQGEQAFKLSPWSIMHIEDLKNSNRNPLRTRVLNNLKDEILDVTMVLGEIFETTDMIGDNLVRVARSMDMVRKRKPESFRYLMTGKREKGRRPTEKFLAEVSSDYLEWKYGIMPTIMDIEGASKALDMTNDGSLFDNPPLLVARAQLKETVHKTVDVWLATDWKRLPVPVEVDLESKARIDYHVSGEGLRGLSRFGIGLTSAATLVFERTPYAFLLNMAVPLADTIKAWGALSGGVTVRGYSETHAIKYRVPAGFANVQSISGNGIKSYEWDKVEPTGLTFDRYGATTVPMPTPYVRNPVRLGNLTTALSLFTQMWTSIRVR